MRRSLLPYLPVLLASALTIAAQGPSASLQTGVPVEKTLAARQTHSYTVRLEKDQFAQLTIEQRGIDVVGRVFGPEGHLIMQVDSPTGTENAEYVEIVADDSGTYRIDVSPLAEGDVSSGNYQITLTELRKATEQERHAFNNVRTRKAKGAALLIETMQYVDQLRLPQTRVGMRIKAAQLLWDSDQKRASKLIGEAVEDARRVVAQMIEHDEPDYSSYQRAMDMRQRLIRVLAARDPEAALKFFQSTRIPAELTVGPGQTDPEVQLEFQLVNEVAAADPKRAFELAQDLLKRSSSATLIQTLNRLTSKDRELAVRLARDISAKLTHQQLATSRDAAMLATGLLNLARSSKTDGSQNRADPSGGGLLSADDFRNLFLKIIAEVQSYSQSPNAVYSPEQDGVRSLAAMIRFMPNELKTYAPDRAALIDKKIAELLGSAEQGNTDWSRFQSVINVPSVDAALESISEVPVQMRDVLYQQIAMRIANSGELARAKQIISERIVHPSQRQTALRTLEQQAITTAAEKGRFDEALRLLSKFRPGVEREDLVVQVLSHLDRRVKKQLAMQYLSEGKHLITSASRAEDQEQMHRLLSIACILADYDVNQAFEMVEPLRDQFNEISAAAVTMNGFGNNYYNDGELIDSNDNPIALTASRFSDALATLAMVDFDRAKTAANGINRLDVRLRIFLLMAERTMEISLEPDEPTGYNSDE